MILSTDHTHVALVTHQQVAAANNTLSLQPTDKLEGEPQALSRTSHTSPSSLHFLHTSRAFTSAILMIHPISPTSSRYVNQLDSLIIHIFQFYALSLRLRRAASQSSSRTSKEIKNTTKKILYTIEKSLYNRPTIVLIF